MLATLQVIGAIVVFIAFTLGATLIYCIIDEQVKTYKKDRKYRIMYGDSHDRKALIKTRNEIDKLLAKLE